MFSQSSGKHLWPVLLSATYVSLSQAEANVDSIEVSHVRQALTSEPKRAEKEKPETLQIYAFPVSWKYVPGLKFCSLKR